MKTCGKCGLEKSLEDFHRSSRSPDGRQARCKECAASVHAGYYRDNPQKWADARRASKERVRSLILQEIEKRGGCADCPETNPIVMDWDHVRGEKLFHIAESANMGNSLKKVLEEIAKCDLVCSNCHRIRTANRNPLHWSHQIMAPSSSG